MYYVSFCHASPSNIYFLKLAETVILTFYLIGLESWTFSGYPEVLKTRTNQSCKMSEIKIKIKMGNKTWWSISNKLKQGLLVRLKYIGGMACSAGNFQVFAEGSGLWQSVFLPFGQKMSLLWNFWVVIVGKEENVGNVGKVGKRKKK